MTSRLKSPWGDQHTYSPASPINLCSVSWPLAVAAPCRTVDGLWRSPTDKEWVSQAPSSESRWQRRCVRPWRPLGTVTRTQCYYRWPTGRQAVRHRQPAVVVVDCMAWWHLITPRAHHYSCCCCCWFDTTSRLDETFVALQPKQRRDATKAFEQLTGRLRTWRCIKKNNVIIMMMIKSNCLYSLCYHLSFIFSLLPYGPEW